MVWPADESSVFAAISTKKYRKASPTLKQVFEGDPKN